jgi:hypothetical protein
MRLRTLPLLLLGFMATACLKVPRQTAFMSALRSVDAPTGEVRLVVEDFGRRFVSTIETAADSIDGLSDDPVVKRRALSWKVYGIPAAQEAVLQPDPAIAMLDIWAFAVQMRNYLEEGPGINAFGAQQEIAVNAARGLVDQSLATAGGLTTTGAVGDLGIRIVEDFAANNPIDSKHLTRRSILSLWVAEVGGEGGGIAGMASSIDRSVDEISTRLSFYNEYLMKEVRWNAQILLEDLTTMQQLDTTLISLRGSVERIATMTEALPDMVGSERAIILEALDRELVAVMNALDHERVEVVAALGAKVDTVLDAVDTERELVLAAVREERDVTMALLDTMLAERIDQTKAVVDHAVWRVAQLLAVMGVVLLIVVIVALRLRRPAGPVTRP